MCVCFTRVTNQRLLSGSHLYACIHRHLLECIHCHLLDVPKFNALLSMKGLRCYFFMTWRAIDCHTESGKVCFVASNFCCPQAHVFCSFFLCVTVLDCGQVTLLLCSRDEQLVWWEVHGGTKPLALQRQRGRRERRTVSQWVLREHSPNYYSSN